MSGRSHVLQQNFKWSEFMTKDRFYIEDAGKHDGQIVTVRGWVYNKRSSGKIKFLILRDGTGLLQGVLFKGECTEEAFGEFEKLTQESSIEVIGKLRKEPRSPGGFELGVQSIKIVQVADPYPISLKEHGVEFLMENAISGCAASVNGPLFVSGRKSCDPSRNFLMIVGSSVLMPRF